MTKIRLTPILFALAGLTFLSWLLIREGIGGLITVFSLVGLNFFWVAMYRVIPISIDALGWRQLFEKGKEPALTDFVMSRWLAESINTLLPVGQVGGHYLRARTIGQKNKIEEEAGATVTVDFTIGLFTQIIFILIGLVFLLQQVENQTVAGVILIGAAVAFFAVSGFFWSQKAGMFGFIARSVRIFLQKKRITQFARNTRSLDQKINEIYRRKSVLFSCILWRLVGWLAKSGENWLFLYFTGVPVTLKEAIIIESISTALRSVAFFIPGGLGVQDGAILFVGSLLGLQPNNLLALAVAKRFREIVVGLPGIIWWLRVESRFQKDLSSE